MQLVRSEAGKEDSKLDLELLSVEAHRTAAWHHGAGFGRPARADREQVHRRVWGRVGRRNLEFIRM